MSTHQIKEYLEENNFKTFSGRSTWQHSTILSILQNEKYCGDVIYQKTYRLDCLSKKVIVNNGDKTIYSASSERKADDLFFVDKAIRDEEARIIEYGKLAVSSDHKEEDYKLAIKDSSGRIESLKIQREQIVRQLSCNEAAKKEM